MTIEGSFDLVLEPDFGQFYMRRSEAEWASGQVPSIGYERSLWTNGSFIYVGTDRKWGSTPVQIEVLIARKMVVPDPEDLRDLRLREDDLDLGHRTTVRTWSDI